MVYCGIVYDFEDGDTLESFCVSLSVWTNTQRIQAPDSDSVTLQIYSALDLHIIRVASLKGNTKASRHSVYHKSESSTECMHARHSRQGKRENECRSWKRSEIHSRIRGEIRLFSGSCARVPSRWSSRSRYKTSYQGLLPYIVFDCEYHSVNLSNHPFTHVLSHLYCKTLSKQIVLLRWM